MNGPPDLNSGSAKEMFTFKINPKESFPLACKIQLKDIAVTEAKFGLLLHTPTTKEVRVVRIPRAQFCLVVVS